MEAKKKYMMDCHLAGVLYHDANEVWEQLKPGTTLRLVRELDNRYDLKAVAVVYDNKETDEEVCIGYIPRAENEVIALFLEMDWTDIFDCRIRQINPEAHPEQQIQLVIKVKRNKEKTLITNK